MKPTLTRPAKLVFSVIGVAFLALWFGAVTPAAAQSERIVDFHSRIEVQKNGDLIVTETIRVFARGARIKRGIYREFPTAYRDRFGKRVRMGFEVLEVLRDGRPEGWHVRDASNGKRVYIGRKNVMLPRGRLYSYTLKYRTTRQIGFFEKFDELYWNVTGNGWAFVIERAGATVVLPPGATVVQQSAYTGPAGAKGRNWEVYKNQDGNITFSTTRRLGRREGLTIAVAWPKGFVTPPTSAEKVLHFATDNLGAVIGLVGLLIVIAYYFDAWLAVGRDPAKGVVIPRFRPPGDFTPAAARFVMRMKFDNKAFAAAVLSMAVKGYLTIRESGKKKFTLELAKGAETGKLSRGERKIAGALFGSSTKIVLEQKNHKKIRKAINSLKESLKTDFEILYFLRNRKRFFIGLGLTAVTVIAVMGAESENAGAVFMGIWLSIWTIGCYFLLQRVWSSWTTGNKAVALIVGVFALPFVAGEVAGIYALSTVASPVIAAILIAIASVNVLFAYLLKAPTREGRRVMDEIEGLKLYMSVAERDRLEKLHPPAKTPELFEKLLPYALALDVENEWSQQFADVLATAGTADARPGHAWSPSWYSGSSWRGFGATDFAGSFSSSFSSAISSSSTAPGSSSGSGGGGSSGGGGGGGGGGGW